MRTALLNECDGVEVEREWRGVRDHEAVHVAWRTRISRMRQRQVRLRLAYGAVTEDQFTKVLIRGRSVDAGEQHSVQPESLRRTKRQRQWPETCEAVAQSLEVEVNNLILATQRDMRRDECELQGMQLLTKRLKPRRGARRHKKRQLPPDHPVNAHRL